MIRKSEVRSQEKVIYRPLMKSYLWLAISVCFISCGEFSGDVTAPMTPALQLIFAPSVQDVTNITRLRVTLVGSRREVLQQEFDVGAGETSTTLNLVVPTDATRIQVEAFETGNPEPAFIGDASIVLAETSSSITVQLDPATTVLRLEPSAREILVDDAFDLAVALKRVENLFAMTVEIAFDDALLEVTGVEVGGFWTGETLLIADHDLEGRAPGRLNIGVTRVGALTGLSGSGTIVVVQFRAKQAGEGRIRVLNNSKLSLQQPDGRPINRFEDLIRFLGRGDPLVTIAPR